MAIKIGAQQDFDQIPVLGLVFEPSPTPPPSPVNGQAWQDTTNDRFMVFLSDQWREVALVGGHTHDVSEVENLAAGVLEPLQEAVATHTSDTTEVHGIPDTSLLETISGAQAKVDAAVAALKGGAPETLDALNEIAAALAEDQGVLDTLLNQIGTKANDADLAQVAKTGIYTDLTGRPLLATVATSGAYADLSGAPVTPTYSDDGESLPVRPNVNFTGLGVTAYDDPAGDGQTIVAIPGGGAMTWNGTAYTARPVVGVPGVFVGPVSPYDLGLMIDGDSWVNNAANPYEMQVYIETGELDGEMAGHLSDITSAAYLAAKAVADASSAAVEAKLPLDVRHRVQSNQTSLDEFDTAISPNWIRADPSNPERVTWRQGGGSLGFSHTGGDAASILHALLRPAANLAVGEAWETCCRMLSAWNASSTMIGLMVATSGTATQYMLATNFWTDSSVSGAVNVGIRQHTNLNAATGGDGGDVAPWGGSRFMMLANIYMRLARTGTNQWEAQFSSDGINWVLTDRLTPARLNDPYTHVGFYCSTWASSVPFAGSFDYLRKVTL